MAGDNSLLDMDFSTMVDVHESIIADFVSGRTIDKQK